MSLMVHDHLQGRRGMQTVSALSRMDVIYAPCILCAIGTIGDWMALGNDNYHIKFKVSNALVWNDCFVER